MSQTFSRALLAAAFVTGSSLAALMTLDFGWRVSNVASHWPAAPQDWRRAALDEALPSHGIPLPDAAVRPANFPAPLPSTPPDLASSTGYPIVGSPYSYHVNGKPARMQEVVSVRLVSRKGDMLLLAVAGQIVADANLPSNRSSSILVEVRRPDHAGATHLQSL